MPQIISPVSAFTSFPLTRYRSSCIRNIVNIRRPTRIRFQQYVTSRSIELENKAR